MPSQQDHLLLADHNQQAIEYLLKADPGFPDWITTVAFYKAVHLVEAVLAHDSGTHSGDHVRRSQYLKTNNRYKQLHLHYGPLKRASEIARYLQDASGTSYKSFADYLTLEAVNREMLKHRLHQIELSARHLMQSKPGK